MLRTFETDQNLYDEFKALCVKERENVGSKINELMEKYIKEHGDGNPQFTIDQFEDPDFIACPAFYRSGDDWKQYMQSQNPEELEKIKHQIILIDRKLGEAIK